jgi:hypothetical protein
MPATNTKAGRMPCETCGDSVWVKTTGAGKLAYRCEGCGSGHFAEKGDRAYRKWASTMQPYADPEAKPAPVDPEPPAPPPARKPAASVFTLGAL